MERPVKVYRNSDVERIVAAIPSGHYHTRFAIYLNDQVIVLQEATIAALVRAYAYTSIHPTRRGVILERRRLSRESKKQGFASDQLLEVPNSEMEAVEIIDKIMGR